MDFFNRLLGRGAPVTTSRPGWPPAPQSQYPAAWSAPKAKPSVSPTAGLKGASRLLGPVGIGLDIYETGKQVFNPQDNIITLTQRLGSGIGNLIQGRPYLSGSTISQANPGQYYGPAYASSEAMGLLSTQGLRNYGPGYKEEELAQGRKAEAFRPGAGFPGQQGAADRAYEAEKSRVAQLTAQDPELQRYEAARLKAVAPGATQEQVQSAEDIGMQIWAQRNPTLAAKVKPGQAGYDVIQGTLAGQAVAEGYGYQMPQQIMMTPPPGVNAPQGLPAVQSIAPTETYGAKGLEVDPEMRKKFQALLNQTQAQ